MDHYRYALNEERTEAVDELREYLHSYTVDAQADLQAEIDALNAEVEQEAERLQEEEPEICDAPFVCGSHLTENDTIEGQVARRIGLRPWRRDGVGRQWYKKITAVPLVPESYPPIAGEEPDVLGVVMNRVIELENRVAALEKQTSEQVSDND
jgi:hypothetical protein